MPLRDDIFQSDAAISNTDQHNHQVSGTVCIRVLEQIPVSNIELERVQHSTIQGNVGRSERSRKVSNRYAGLSIVGSSTSQTHLQIVVSSSKVSDAIRCGNSNAGIAISNHDMVYRSISGEGDGIGTRTSGNGVTISRRSSTRSSDGNGIVARTSSNRIAWGGVSRCWVPLGTNSSITGKSPGPVCG